jgi:hypothetical protein
VWGGRVLESRLGISRLLNLIYAYMTAGDLFFQNPRPSPYLGIFLKLITCPHFIIDNFINQIYVAGPDPRQNKGIGYLPKIQFIPF